MHDNDKFYEYMKSKTDEQFLDLLCQAENTSVIDGFKMPVFPDESLQKQFVGSSGGTSLKNEGWLFYKLVKEYCHRFNVPINSTTKILDFGCGWGRMIRFYFKDMPSRNIYGVDVDPEIIQICKDTLNYGNYSTCDPLPPTTFADDSFDIIFSYSVFSHLREDVANKWIQEFSRILKPNGILVATTQGEGFLDFCKSLNENPEQKTTGWHEALANCFLPIEESRQRYSKGEFLYAPTGGGGVRESSFYGEAIIPQSYIKETWGKLLKFLEYFYDTNRLPQAVFVLQKLDSSSRMKLRQRLGFLKKFTM